MDHKAPSVSADEFAVLAKRAGLELSEAQAGMMYGVFGHFEAMLDRLRRPLDAPRGRGAEPAHVFVPGQEWVGLAK